VNFDVPPAACSGNVRFRATAMLPAPNSTDPLHPTLPPLAFATGATDVTFIDRQRQMILPLLITDPLSSAPVPTLTDFNDCLDGPIRMHPFPDNGFIVNLPPIGLTLSVTDSLFATLGWERLLAKLMTMAFLFQSQPVGGIRAAVAPTDVPPASRDGMALPSIGPTVASFIIRSGRAVTCTHELAHTYGLQHVDCGSPAGPFDASLPFTLANPAVDVANRVLWPPPSTRRSPG